MTKTHLVRTLSASQQKIQYDEHVKNLLSHKVILAWILRSTAIETAHMNIDEIISCIGDRIDISNVPVAPGESNNPDVPRIVGDNNESTIPYEGKISSFL